MLKNVNLWKPSHWKTVTASPLRKGYAVHELWYQNKFLCPVCRRAGPLYIDVTVAAALACLPASVSKVAFTESGRFMAVEEHEVEYLMMHSGDFSSSTISQFLLAAESEGE